MLNCCCWQGADGDGYDKQWSNRTISQSVWAEETVPHTIDRSIMEDGPRDCGLHAKRESIKEKEEEADGDLRQASVVDTPAMTKSTVNEPEEEQDARPEQMPVAPTPSRTGPVSVKAMTVTLTKDEKQNSMGLDIMRSESGTPCLKIMNIKEGLVQDWNESNPRLQVLVNDLIVEVNGKAESCDALLERIHRDRSLILKLVRLV